MIIPSIRISAIELILSDTESPLYQMWAERDRLIIQDESATHLSRQIERMEDMIRMTKDLLKATNTITLEASE